MLTLQFLQNLAEHHGDDVALDDGDTAVSYGELVAAVNSLAVALQNKDPIPGSRVALCAATGLEYLVSVLAVQAAGKILIPMNPQDSQETLYEILLRTLPTTVIVDETGDKAIRCEDEIKITFGQFEGLVRTYFGQQPEAVDLSQVSPALPVLPETQNDNAS